MRHGFLRLLMFAVMTVLFCTACDSPPARYVNAHHGSQAVVAIWLDPKAGLPPEDTLVGCNYWNEMDVRCVMAKNLVEADVVIMSDDHPCSPNGDGTMDIAYASSYRVISVRVDCFYDTKRVTGFDGDEYRSVIAHEIGHELGIWDHVPLACDKKSEQSGAEGARRCGRAIMNPVYDKKVLYLTQADGVAFDQRDSSHTVLPPRAVSDRDACVMTTRGK